MIHYGSLMNYSDMTAQAICQELGLRLKNARLNNNLTQTNLAAIAGISRKIVISAEKGKAQLEVVVAILQALDLTEQLKLFIPEQAISPIQLAKLEGRKRQRASKSKPNPDNPDQTSW